MVIAVDDMILIGTITYSILEIINKILSATLTHDYNSIPKLSKLLIYYCYRKVKPLRIVITYESLRLIDITI